MLQRGWRIASHRVYGKLRVHEAGINYTFDACREPRNVCPRYAQSRRWHAWDKEGTMGNGVRRGGNSSLSIRERNTFSRIRPDAEDIQSPRSRTIFLEMVVNGGKRRNFFSFLRCYFIHRVSNQWFSERTVRIVTKLFSKVSYLWLDRSRNICIYFSSIN